MKKIIKKVANKLGLDVKLIDKNQLKEYDEFIDLYNECKPYTMTSIERMFSLYKAVEYIIKNDVPGDFYECGVWRGGSSMMIALTLKKFKSNNRNLYLFDTYDGMSEPTDADKDAAGTPAAVLLEKSKKEVPNSVWCFADLADVQNNMKRTGYPADKIFYIQGKVEDTLNGFVPKDKIAILRLDTDWYESTKVEMNVLFPSLEVGGVLIIDDYGFWDGARKAIDEYISEHKLKILLNRIDDTGRIAIKM